MRSIAIVSIATGSLLLSVPAFAEGGPKLTRDQIVCQMTGDCDSSAVVDNSQKYAKPKEASFNFTKTTKSGTPASVKPVAAAPVTLRNARPGYTRPSAAAPAPGRRQVARVSSLAIPISFQRGSAELSGDARKQIVEFAAALQSSAMTGRNVVIEGHTDSKGARTMNLDLSERRARAVADYLVSQQIDSGRVKAVGYGPDRPLPQHDSSSPDNRRVQFSLAN